MISAAVLAIARAEIRRGWRALLVIGLLAGLVGATTVSALALARRTTTAYDRLGQATAVDDARGAVHVHDELVDEIVALPEVTGTWTGRTGVAQLEGTFTFLGMIAGPEEPSDLLRPIVLEGRLPAAAEGDVIEVALRDDFQRVFDLAIGTELTGRFLTEDDYFRFDTGFLGGAPHGPELALRVVGTFRLGGGFTTLPPGIAAPDALRDHPEAFEPGASWFVSLAGGERSFPEFRRGVERLAEGLTLPPVGAEFVVADVTNTAEAAATVDHTADLLGRALVVLAVTVGAVGLVALLQAFARHHAASASEREVEAALGLTGGELRTARLLASAPSALLSVTIASVTAVVTSRLEPIGAVRHYEPAPGAALHLAIVPAGVVLTGVAVMAACLIPGTSPRRRLTLPLRESNLVTRLSLLGGSPAGVTGLRFALEPGRGARAVPVRSAITGAIVGLAGVIGGLVFTSSLDRLVDSPARTGVPYDAMVSDVTARDLQTILANEKIATVVAVSSAGLVVDGQTVDGHAMTDHRGALEVDLAEGRLPRTPDEVVLGLRVARDLGKGVGDTVTVTDGGGDEHVLAVVGTGVVPTFNGELLGLNALVTRVGLARTSLSGAFTSAAVIAAPGVEPRGLIDQLAEEFEADAQAVPSEVDNLRQLGRLPSLVAGLVGAIAVLALAHAVVTLVTRRRHDLALLRTVGFTRSQTATAVVVMAVTIAAIGVAIGVPVGLAVGSTVWALTAGGAFVTTDPLVPWLAIAATSAAALVIVLAAALLPARQAGRTSAAALLRVE